MIDLHSHVAFGYDDGARDLDDSLAMARQYATEGVQTVVATPHVGAWSWGPPPLDLAERCDLISRAAAAEHLDLRVLPGAEVFLLPDVGQRLDARDAGHRPIGDSRYVLVEFSMSGEASGVLEALEDLQQRGWRPILAHPERNRAFQRSVDLLVEALAAGVLVQVTAGSLLGDFGSTARELGERLVRSDLAAIVASDAHRPTFRQPRLGAAREWLARELGDEVASRLVVDNPCSILADEPITVSGEPNAARGPQRSFWEALGA